MSAARTKPRDRILAMLAMATVIVAWFLGYSRHAADLLPYLERALPEADRFESLSGDTWAGWTVDSRLAGYVQIGAADGYGGPLQMAVALDTGGTVIGITIIDQVETPTFIGKVLREGYPQALLGRSVGDPLLLGQDVDGISGATYTVSAMVENVRRTSRDIGESRLGLKVPAPHPRSLRFGWPEIMLIAMYLVGFLNLRYAWPGRAWLRWLSLLMGLVMIGFVLNQPLTLAFLNRLLLGFWPAWQEQLYWYLLVGGLLLFMLIDDRNVYCDSICPFGAAQECVGKIGGARRETDARVATRLKWAHRVLVWLAVVTALVLRHPSISSYEVFGALFDFTGSRVLFVLLGLVLLTSLVYRRPWCRYLCPITAFADLIRFLRSWGRDQWRRAR